MLHPLLYAATRSLKRHFLTFLQPQSAPGTVNLRGETAGTAAHSQSQDNKTRPETPTSRAQKHPIHSIIIDMSVCDVSQNGGAASPSSQSPNSRKQAQDKIVKCPWTKEDDIKVGELVIQYGTKSWSALAAHLPGRTGKQIRERWHNQV